MRHRKAALPRADDQAIQHRRAAAGFGLKPGGTRMGHQFKVAAYIGFKVGQIARGRHAGRLLSFRASIQDSGAGRKTTAKPHLKAVQGHVFAPSRLLSPLLETR